MRDQRIPLADAVAPARDRHAATVEAFVTWSAVLGRSPDPDVAALIHAAEDDRDRKDGWDRAGFYSFYRCDLWNWCALANCVYPDGVPEVLWLWLHHRDVTGRGKPEDEPLHELLKVLLCYGDIGFDGRPMTKTRRLVPCECYVSTRYAMPTGTGDEPPPTVEDLDRELEAELGHVPRRHG